VSESLFLSPDELAEFTGRKLQSAQQKWLQSAGYAFTVNANGRPIVARDYILARLGVAVSTVANSSNADAPRPNFGALKAP